MKKEVKVKEVETELEGVKIQQVRKYPPCVGKRFILNYV